MVSQSHVGKTNAKRKMSRKCKVCRTAFEPDRPMQRVCGGACALTLAITDRARKVKAAAAQERKKDRARREVIKSRADWAREAQTAVNRYVRLRDMAAGRGCITCGAYPAQKWGGTMDAGHFRSVGSAPHLRFYLPQIAMQCVTCNRYKGGRALDFRAALAKQRGPEWVEKLESMQGLAKFNIEYLKRIKKIFSKKARRIEARMAEK